MRHSVVWFALVVLALLFVLGRCHAQPRDNRDAIVAIPSHGVTGTVIKTQAGKSWILSAAHGWLEYTDRRALPVVVAVPERDGTKLPEATGHPRLVAIDKDLDLALIELPCGPLPCIPVAARGYKLGVNFVSCGYDEMRRAKDGGPQIYLASVRRDDGRLIWTSQAPWHGRSGGPLIDADAGVLVGTVEGFEGNPMTGKPVGPNPGMYINTHTVQEFVFRYFGEGQTTDLPAPRDQYEAAKQGRPVRVEEGPVIGRGSCPCPSGRCPCPNGACPDCCPGGVCPNGQCPTGRCPNGQCPTGRCPNGQCTPSRGAFQGFSPAPR